MRPLVEACVKVQASNLFFIELSGRFRLNESIYKSASRKKNANRVTLMFIDLKSIKGSDFLSVISFNIFKQACHSLDKQTPVIFRYLVEIFPGEERLVAGVLL